MREEVDNAWHFDCRHRNMSIDEAGFPKMSVPLRIIITIWSSMIIIEVAFRTPPPLYAKNIKRTKKLSYDESDTLYALLKCHPSACLFFLIHS